MIVTTMMMVVSCLAPERPGLALADSLLPLYHGGKTWAQFFDAARARRETWKDNYANGAPAAELVERAKAVSGRWHILAVAEDWCGDSANTVPYLVRLVEQAPNLEIRIVNSTIGRWVMERHQTPDGRAATPTIVLLDAEGNERGCFVERPAPLRAWVAEHKPKLGEDAFQEGKIGWYRTDRGKATVAEMVELLEKTGAGPSTC